MTALGEPLALGRTARVYAYGEERVLKLYRPGTPTAVAEGEAAALKAAKRAGLPVPAVYGVVSLDDRPGLVLEGGEPHSLQWSLEHGAIGLEAAARLTAELQAEVHTVAAPELPPAKERLRKRIEGLSIDGGPWAGIARRALERLVEMPEGDRLLHGDFHPGNLITRSTSDDAPLIIDWPEAARGVPAADVARSWILYTAHVTREDEAPRAAAEYDELGRRFYAVYFRHYAELTGLDSSAVDAWRLPVAVARLAEEIPGLGHRLLPLCRKLAAE